MKAKFFIYPISSTNNWVQLIIFCFFPKMSLKLKEHNIDKDFSKNPVRH